MVSVLSPDILPDIRMTVDEYLVADLPEGHRYELVEGVVHVTPVPGIPHDSVIICLTRILARFWDENPDKIGYFTHSSAVTLVDRETAREPDFAVYGTDELGDKTGKTWKDVTPMLVVEVVSPGQEERDYDEKRRDYWDAGIAEYWIADPARKTLTVLTRAASSWKEDRLDETQRVRSGQFPGLEIQVAALFA